MAIIKFLGGSKLVNLIFLGGQVKEFSTIVEHI